VILAKDFYENSRGGMNMQSVSHKSVTVGKERFILTPILLDIVTLGIYHYIWLYKITDEMLNHTGDRTISPGKTIGFLFIPIFNIGWAIYLTFHIPELIKKMDLDDGIPMHEQTNALLIGILGIIPLIMVAWTPMLQSALNKHWKRHAIQKEVQYQLGDYREQDSHSVETQRGPHPVNQPSYRQDRRYGNASLRQYAGGQELMHCDLSKTVNNIGRHETNDIIISDDSVSRQQAIIFIENGRYYIKNLSSVNPTIVNNQRIIATLELNNGDQIRFGEVVLTFIRDQ